MAQAKSFLSFEEYLNPDNAENLPEGRHEYVDGELVALMPESEENDWIANYLFYLLIAANITKPWLIRPGRCEVEVGGKPRTRYPDLVILDEAHPSLTKRRLMITRDMPPPQLVAEVVSSGKKNRERDTVEKREQYAERGIPEYWLIDPENQSITVLTLVNGSYQEYGVFQGSDRVNSVAFGELPLTAEEILKAGRDLGERSP